MNDHKFNALVTRIANETEIAIHDVMKTDPIDVNRLDREHLWNAIYDLMAGLPYNYGNATSGIEDLETMSDSIPYATVG